MTNSFFNSHHSALELLLLFMALLTTSCSESTQDDNEYSNWENRNNEYFESIYNQAVAKREAGDNSWMLIKSFSKDPNSTGSHTDYIVVHVLSQNEAHDEATSKEATPLFTDSVMVHYRGNLIPSTSYADGYEFDSSWKGDYDLTRMIPTKFSVNGTINGFSTALMNMHPGDRWCVYIPWQLGYGSASSASSIPNYSVLKFDITLYAFSKPGKKLPDYQ